MQAELFQLVYRRTCPLRVLDEITFRHFQPQPFRRRLRRIQNIRDMAGKGRIAELHG